MGPRFVIDVVMKRNILVLRSLLRSCFLYCITATGNEGTAAQPRPAFPGAAGGDGTAAGAGSTAECCHCLSQEENSGMLLLHM